MMATIDTMVQVTEIEGQFTTEWCWYRVRNYYPGTLVPTKMFVHEDRFSEWLTFKNINQWIDGTKQIFFDFRFFKDKHCTFTGK